MSTQHVVVPTYPDGRVSAKGAATYLGLAEKTLAMMRSKGKGPKFVKRGRIYYYLEDLDKWLREARVSSTAQARLLVPQAVENSQVALVGGENE